MTPYADPLLLDRCAALVGAAAGTPGRGPWPPTDPRDQRRPGRRQDHPRAGRARCRSCRPAPRRTRRPRPDGRLPPAQRRARPARSPAPQGCAGHLRRPGVCRHAHHRPRAAASARCGRPASTTPWGNPTRTPSRSPRTPTSSSPRATTCCCRTAAGRTSARSWTRCGSATSPAEQRRARLVDRHVLTGREVGDAEAWVDRSDEANARLVVTGRLDADLVLVDGRVVGA